MTANLVRRLRSAATRCLPVLLCLLAASQLEAQEQQPPPKSSGGFLPTGRGLGRAVKRALRDPGTWLPAAAAGVIGVGDWDGEISRWAVRHTPIFGSTGSAVRAGSDLRWASHGVMAVSALFVGETDHPWRARMQREAWEHGGVITTVLLTSALKAVTARLRPDESNYRSFPSGHASSAFAYSAASMRNIMSIDMPRPVQFGLAAGAGVLAAGTAWSRVESGVHYTTDVLVGAAVGNMVSVIFYDLFMSRQQRTTVSFKTTGRDAGVSARITW